MHPANKKSCENSVDDEQAESHKRSRSFNTGDFVWFRNFGRGEKWLPGTVRATGARNYEIEVDGEVQSRHVDQLRSRVQSGTTTPNDQNITPQTSVPPDPQQEQEEDVILRDAPTVDVLPDRVNEEATVVESEQTSTKSTRPQRQRNIPTRLKDYHMGEEL